MSSYSQQMSRIAALFGGNQNSYGLPLSNRNYIVDGNFDSWIAASVVLGVAGFGHASTPMYYNYAGVGGNATISQGQFAPGAEPIGMTSPAVNYLTHTQTVASSGVFQTTGPYFQNIVESVRTLEGRSATFSCWLWCASGTLVIPSILVQQGFGTGGSPSANVGTTVTTNWTVTTTPQRFSVLVSVPSVSGKTLGTSGTDYILVQVPLPVGATYAINTAQWQLEQSSPNAPVAGYPTAFEYRGQQAEGARVARYYQSYSVGAGAGFMNTTTANATSAYGWADYPGGQMRATPACAVVGGALSGSYSGSLTSATLSAVNASVYQVVATLTGATTGYAGYVQGGTGGSTLVFDARL